MQEEIFGPILPILTYATLEEAIRFVKAREKPLAFYLFTTDRTTEKRVLRKSRLAAAVSTTRWCTSPRRTWLWRRRQKRDGELPWQKELRYVQPL